jgi:hypothetical protein
MEEYLCVVTIYRQASRSLHVLDGDEYAAALRKTTWLWTLSQRISAEIITHQELAHGLKLGPSES